MRNPMITAQVLRATKIDSCGRVVPGVGSSILTTGFMTVKATPQVDAGADKSLTKGNGDKCAQSKAADTIKYYDLQVALCAVDPDIVTLFNPAWATIISNLGTSVGWEGTDQIESVKGVGIETWSNVEGTDVCTDPTATGSWGYWLWPWTTAWSLDAFTVGPDYVDLTLKGRSKNNALWGKGPWNVVLNGSAPGTPGKLLANVGKRAHYHFEQTRVPPPTEQLGLMGVSAANGPAFTIVKTTSDATGMSVDLGVLAGLATGTYKVNWGDGTVAATIMATTTTHAYATAGTYNISVYLISDPTQVSYITVTVPLP